MARSKRLPPLNLLYLLLAPLESAEVVLDEVGGVEPADGHLIAACRRYDLIQQLVACSLPQLLDNCAKLLIRFVNGACHASDVTTELEIYTFIHRIHANMQQEK